jgi:glycosyltransferase involved in cell wall biosynthesis
MNIIVSKGSVNRSSFGVKNYYNRIFQYLQKYDDLKFSFSNIENRLGLSLLNNKNSTIWFPAFYGSIIQKRQVITIHDCINITHSDINFIQKSLYKKFVSKILSQQPHLVAISEFTKSEFLNNYNYNESNVTVIKSGFDILDLPIHKGKVAQNKSSNEHILWITNNLSHKNNSFAIKSFINSDFKKTNLKLIIVGKISKNDESLLFYNKINYENLLKIETEQLINLYRNSFFVYSPTLIEGHNLCISEALQFNTNVLCSDIPVHREYYEKYVKFFSPIDMENAICSLNKAMFDSSFWNHFYGLKELSKFSETASKYYTLFKNIGSE